ncbi:MAG: hypothetical protein ACRDBM_06195 [Sporomusa sp.]
MGHLGKNRELPKNLDELVKKGFVRRETVDHTNGAQSYISRYVLDLDFVVVVTEIRYAQGSVPVEQRAPVIYGNKIRALVGLLSADGFMARNG